MSYRPVVEEGLKISIDELRRKGLIIPNAKSTFSKRWMNRRSNRCLAKVWFLIQTHGTFGTMHLKFQALTPMAGEYEIVEQSIHLLTKPQPFGGHRWFARCPVTGESCTKLYRPRGEQKFAARAAWPRLCYRVQREDAHGRAVRRAYKLRRRLGDSDGVIGAFIFKPKWMRDRTFQREMLKLAVWEHRATNHLVELLEGRRRSG